jgi:outer membrane protein assembly factor BamE (lipoprotein component of BamABCDE complex)
MKVFHLLLLAMCVLALASCQKRLRKANVDEVTDGMSKKQVESILGMPTTSEMIDFKVMKRAVYVYKQDNGTVTITFKDDKVETKESTLAE